MKEVREKVKERKRRKFRKNVVIQRKRELSSIYGNLIEGNLSNQT